MALYHEAADILKSVGIRNVSVKSLVYTKKGWKSDPKTLFALSTESAKWSEVLAEVIEKSGILKIEKQLTPELALVLVHDLFLSKRGIALPASHGLHASASRHKVRLSAELTKARLRRGCASLDQLRTEVNQNRSGGSADAENQKTAASKHPRWVRVNTLKSTFQDQLDTTFAEYTQTSDIPGLLQASHLDPDTKYLCQDRHVPDLLAISPQIDLTTTKAYKQGQIILQDKASCFPAYLLNPDEDSGDIVDACAAPGNKTTHTAALLSHSGSGGKVVACEKDALRSLTLIKMTRLAGGEKIIAVKAKQDFMKLDPSAKEFANVTGLLLDPSCSGSGIVGRDEGGLVVHLPSTMSSSEDPAARGKKRKRQNIKSSRAESKTTTTAPQEEVEEHPALAVTATDNGDKLAARLENLSGFQLRLLQRAMSFPAARRITYSTCSIHAEENEHVVVKALLSPVARERGWRIMSRGKQVEGMKAWELRGWRSACDAVLDEVDGEIARDGLDASEVAEGCIRCDKGSGEGTMGFFVAGFVRDAAVAGVSDKVGSFADNNGVAHKEEDQEEWNGFDD